MALFKKCIGILSYIDLLGYKFNLKIDKKEKIRSPIGGILSLIAIVALFSYIYNSADEKINYEISRLFSFEGDFSLNEHPVVNGRSYTSKSIIIAYPVWLNNYQKLIVTLEEENKVYKSNLNPKN